MEKWLENGENDNSQNEYYLSDVLPHFITFGEIVALQLMVRTVGVSGQVRVGGRAIALASLATHHALGLPALANNIEAVSAVAHEAAPDVAAVAVTVHVSVVVVTTPLS